MNFNGRDGPFSIFGTSRKMAKYQETKMDDKTTYQLIPDLTCSRNEFTSAVFSFLRGGSEWFNARHFTDIRRNEIVPHERRRSCHRVTSLSEQDLEIASFLTVLITHPIHEQISNLISVSLKYENWSFQLKIMLSH